jgi:hypothetical protein
MNLPFENARLPGASHFGARAIATDLRAIRERAPLVRNITNFVVMQQTANALFYRIIVTGSRAEAAGNARPRVKA